VAPLLFTGFAKHIFCLWLMNSAKVLKIPAAAVSKKQSSKRRECFTTSPGNYIVNEIIRTLKNSDILLLQAN